MDKQQVIDTYIENSNKKSILGFLGINKFLGVDNAIKQYLNGENKPDIKSTEGFWDFLKGSIMINFFLKDKKNELDKLKEYLDLNKDNKIQLESLAAEIKKWTTVEKAIITNSTAAPTTNPEVPTVPTAKTDVLPVAPTPIIETQSPNTEIKIIKNSIEIKWDFATIKEVKNSDWKIILECKWESPYIHIDALDDVLWLSQIFFQKTWNPLTLSSAYRTIEHQKKLKAEKWDQAASPWESWHNLWLSIDIEWWDRYSKEVWWIKWMKELSKKYNFYPLSTEDWHFDYKTLPDADNRLAQAQVLDRDFQDRDLVA